MNQRSYHKELQMQALKDLTNRAKPGIFVYVAVWFVLSMGAEVQQYDEKVFVLNSFIILTLFLFRLLHLQVHKRVTEDNVEALTNVLLVGIIGGAIHWGGMTAWVLYDENLVDMHASFIVVMAGFAMGGTTTLSISNAVRTFYPIFMFGPSIFVMLLRDDQEGLMYAILMGTSLAYVFVASKSAQSDYWEAITNHMVAQERAQAMERLSITDPLTQLKNRMFFDEEFTKEWLRSSRLQSPVSVLMLDLDHFKLINDTYGHLFGDVVLQKVSQVIANEVKRPTDCVARYGGEEFVILLPSTHEKGSKVIMERIREKVQNINFDNEEHQIKVTCSVGASTAIPKSNSDKSELIKNADSALYTAKKSGRNKCMHYEDI